MLVTLRNTVRYMFDGRVPLLLKLLPIGVVAYVLSPIDLLPEVIPVLGTLDDFSLFVLGLDIFVRVAADKAAANAGAPALPDRD